MEIDLLKGEEKENKFLIKNLEKELELEKESASCHLDAVGVCED